MNWLIPENELDREQRNFLNEFINRSDNELIIGFPGSGKTMLLLPRGIRLFIVCNSASITVRIVPSLRFPA